MRQPCHRAERVTLLLPGPVGFKQFGDQRLKHVVRCFAVVSLVGECLGVCLVGEPCSALYHSLHATILHLLGIDHEKLTVRTNGVDRRLTDVHGHVIKAVLA